MKTRFLLIGIIPLVSLLGLRPLITDNTKYSGNISGNIAQLYSYYEDTLIKIEQNWDPNYDKEKYENESLSIDFSLIREQLKITTSKKEVWNSKSAYIIENTVGVFKDKTCGNYSELEIFLDCEDNNPTTRTYGWTGASYNDGKGNIHIKLCLVPQNDFFGDHGSRNYAYAKYPWAHISFETIYTGSYIDGTTQIWRTFSQEKNNNTNKTTIDGINIYDIFPDAPGGTIFGNRFGCESCPVPAEWEHSTTLQMIYFDPALKSCPDAQYYDWFLFPDLGFSYGLIGRFGPDQGFIYFDDEDKDSHRYNISIESKPKYNCSNEFLDGENYTGIKSIYEGGSNTRFYISKAVNCD